MQQIDFNDGSYIIYACNKQIDLMAKNVDGFQPSGGGNDLAYDWEDAWTS